MKNVTRLVAASGLVLSSMVVHADEPVIYGYISAGVESAGATGSSSATKPTQTRVVDNNSRIGIRGNEDLGNGLKAVWQVESSLRDFAQGGTTDWGQTATIGTRNTFVGFDDASWGRIVAGYNDSVYKSMVGSVSDFGINVMGNTPADNWGSGPGYYSIFSRGETRMKNSLHYTSPRLAGFQFGASYGVDETSGGGLNQTRDSLAAKYVAGGWKIGIGWDRQNDVAGYSTATSALAGKSINFMKLVSSYQFATGTLLGGGVEQGRFDAPGGWGMSQTGWTVAVSQPVTALISVKVSYSRLGALSHPVSGAPDDYRSNQWVLGGTYALSRRTSLFTYYTRIVNGADQNVDFGFSPLVTSTNAANTVVMANGNTLHAVGVGMSVSF